MPALSAREPPPLRQTPTLPGVSGSETNCPTVSAAEVSMSRAWKLPETSVLCIMPASFFVGNAPAVYRKELFALRRPTQHGACPPYSWGALSRALWQKGWKWLLWDSRVVMGQVCRNSLFL